MEFWQAFLPLVIDMLLIILLVVGIVLGIKTIITMSKIEKVVDNVNDKVDSLNSIFGIVDFASDKLAGVVDKTVDFISNMFTKFWYKKSLKKEEKDEEE